MIKSQKEFDQALDAMPEWRRQQLAQALRALAEMPDRQLSGGQCAPAADKSRLVSTSIQSGHFEGSHYA